MAEKSDQAAVIGRAKKKKKSKDKEKEKMEEQSKKELELQLQREAELKREEESKRVQEIQKQQEELLKAEMEERKRKSYKYAEPLKEIVCWPIKVTELYLGRKGFDELKDMENFVNLTVLWINGNKVSTHVFHLRIR